MLVIVAFITVLLFLQHSVLDSERRFKRTHGCFCDDTLTLVDKFEGLCQETYAL